MDYVDGNQIKWEDPCEFAYNVTGQHINPDNDTDIWLQILLLSLSSPSSTEITVDTSNQIITSNNINTCFTLIFTSYTNLLLSK